MTLEQIRKAVAHGLTVHWKSEGYTVTGTPPNLLVTWAYKTRDENSTGLTHQDGVTMNEKPMDFYVSPGDLSYAVDDAGSERSTDEAIGLEKIRYVGFRAGFELVWVAVWSYLNVSLSESDAEELAVDLLMEKGWFADITQVEPEIII